MSLHTSHRSWKCRCMLESPRHNDGEGLMKGTWVLHNTPFIRHAHPGLNRLWYRLTFDNKKDLDDDLFEDSVAVVHRVCHRLVRMKKYKGL